MGAYVGWGVVGAVIGVLVGQDVSLMLVGALLGILFARQASLSRELEDLRQKLPGHHSGATRQAAGQHGSAAEGTITDTPAAAAILPQATAVESGATLFQASTDPVAEPPPAPDHPGRASHPSEAPPPQAADGSGESPGQVDVLFTRMRDWLFGGNLPVKIGMLVVFVGVAAALKYASDIGLLHAPISVRLSIIALVAMLALVFGWRQREQRRGFALALQGGAVGVLVMTVFAAFRLYGLLPPLPAFALLVVLVAGLGVLAVVQDALALAVLGLVAGFAAPVLIATGQGDHVVLFSYYALLNLAIFLMAWYRAWRLLNVLGFVATFVIATAWGVLNYRPAQFASTEPFLIFHFLLYVAIPWLYLRQPADSGRRVMDGALLFGNPLIGLLLQGALLDWNAHALALSTLAVAVFYVLIAWSARGQKHLGLLRDAWAILALAFATLSVPLAFGAQLTGSILALEGAGMVWLGFRQQRAWARWGGLGVQLFALVSVLLGRLTSSADDILPVLNGDFLSLLFVAAGAFISCALYARHDKEASGARLMPVLLYVWGMLWWLLDAAGEIQRFASRPVELAAWLTVFGGSAWLVAEAARRCPRGLLGRWLAFSVPVLFAAMLPLLLWAGESLQQPLAGWALGGVALAGVLGWRALVCVREEAWPAMLAQLAWLWRWGLLAAVAVMVALHGQPLALPWTRLLVAIPLLVLFGLALWRPTWIAWPVDEHVEPWRRVLLYSLLLAAVPHVVAALVSAGDAGPLPFLPLLNPADILLLLLGLALFAFLHDDAMPRELRGFRGPIIGLFSLLVLTGATLRGVHQIGGVPWLLLQLGGSSLAQMALTVTWSVLGLLAWVVGSRRGQRHLWMGGAVLMAVVLLKLLLVDRGHLGNVFGIASFIVFGLLCTLIGYLAPAPPRRGSAALGEEP